LGRGKKFRWEGPKPDTTADSSVNSGRKSDRTGGKGFEKLTRGERAPVKVARNSPGVFKGEKPKKGATKQLVGD